VKTRPFLFASASFSYSKLRLRGVHSSNKNFTPEEAMFQDAMLEDTIFADSILETSWTQRARRSWTTLTSFGLQILIISLLLLLPVLKSVGLPAARTVSTPISLGRVSPEPAPSPSLRTGGPSVVQTSIPTLRFMQPSQIPHVIRMGGDEPAAPAPGSPSGGIEGTGFPSGTGDGLMTNLFGGVRPVLPTPPPALTRAIRTSSMLEGNLIRRVEPVYPPLARSARIQGSVVLVALISKAGTIENLRAVAGHPMLVPAAVNAVSQWRYRPYILNSEVETQITVNFSLSGN
jgi:protein TonB